MAMAPTAVGANAYAAVGEYAMTAPTLARRLGAVLIAQRKAPSELADPSTPTMIFRPAMMITGPFVHILGPLTARQIGTKVPSARDARPLSSQCMMATLTTWPSSSMRSER